MITPELIMEAHEGHEIRRRKDWTEPYAEGDHQLHPTNAGDD